MTDQIHFQPASSTEADLLAPKGIEEVRCVELDHAGSESVKSCGVIGFDSKRDLTENIRKRMRAQCETGGNTKSPSSAAAQSIEKLGLPPLVDDADLTIGSNHFGFEQVGSSRPKLLRKASETTAQCEAADTYGEAAAALNVKTVFG